MPLARCFSSLGCPECSLDEMLQLATKHGLPAVELRALGGTMELADYFAMTYQTPAALAARMQGAPVRIVAFDASLRLVGATEADREQLVAIAGWADAVGVRWLRVFDGGREADATELAEAAKTMRWWRALRSARGWKTDLMVETHDSLFTAAAVERFLIALPGTAILWDSHHTWRKGAEDPLATWGALRSSVVHVHVKDSIPVPSARHPYTYVLPGDGDFPIRPLLTALEGDCFAGPVSLEWEKAWHPYLPSLDTALATAAQRGWW